MIRSALLFSLLGLGIGLSGCAKRTTTRLINGQVRPSRYVSPTAYEHYMRATLHQQKGNHREAVRQLRQALIFDDKAPYLHARLAESLLALRKFQIAATEIRRGLELDASHPDVLLAAALLATTQARFKDAEKVLRRCVAGEVLDERCPLRLASLLERRGHPKEAASVLDTLVARTGSPTGLVARSKLCLAVLNLPCAAKKLEQALSQHRSLPWLVQLARIQQAAGDWTAATKSWREAFGRSSFSLRIARPLLDTLHLARNKTDVDDLLGVLERQVRARAKGRVTVAELMLRAKRPARALALLEHVKELKPKEELVRARALVALKRHEEAHGILHKLLGGPMAADAALQRSRLYERAGKLQGALALLERVQRRAPNAHRLGRERARLLIDRGRIKAGLEILRRAASTKRDPHARLVLARALDRAGRWREAIKEAEAILAKSPDHAPTLNFIGYVLTSRGKRMQHAHTLLKRAHRLHPLEAYIVDSMGFWQLRAGHPRRAITLLEIAHRLDPFESAIAEHLAEAQSTP
ncbi:MAG: tetratricopeptide repeat protein [Deltaproteobacteria bacterium]|nr:tetratricopeptide repeat protein [Deltaproteobacteria bacterium]